MNHCAIQKSAFRNREGMKNFEQETMICPKPRRFGAFNSSFNELPVRSLRRNSSYQVEVWESKAESDILEIILTKAGGGSDFDETSQFSSSPPFFSGSPPSRVSNPLVQDSIFRNDEFIFTQLSPPPPPPLSSSSSASKGGCVRESFRNSPAVRIEGFDCLDRDRRRNRSIPALA